ncbi:MAG: N-acetyl-gamma-glutamyl-phosphate reductase [Coriobacteriia bacterium]|nr:N-acetyl-gamma-glutamyl-phosphate reductase [Coriobacteriia bacterium]
MIRVAVVGGAGYTGIELVRLLLGHPGFEIAAVTSATDSGRAVEELYPALAGCGLSFVEPDVTALARVADVVFLAVPHTAALALAPGFLDAGLKVLDLSADFRLKDPRVYEAWYDTEHTAPGLLPSAVYGLPEIGREGLLGASLVACPGCYPTATIIAAAPALESGLAIPGSKVVVDAKSGVSGAGRSATASTHYCSVNDSIAPYKVASHRHTPEIVAALSEIADSPVKVSFTPHLVPMTRGLLSTVYLEATSGLTTADAVEAYRTRYAEEPFVTVHHAGRMPSTREVSGTNRAHLGVAVDAPSGTLVVACAIDNLVKGSGGQAIQCANIALGMDETAGLAHAGPVI